MPPAISAATFCQEEPDEQEAQSREAEGARAAAKKALKRRSTARMPEGPSRMLDEERPRMIPGGPNQPHDVDLLPVDIILSE